MVGIDGRSLLVYFRLRDLQHFKLSEDLPHFLILQLRLLFACHLFNFLLTLAPLMQFIEHVLLLRCLLQSLLSNFSLFPIVFKPIDNLDLVRHVRLKLLLPILRTCQLDLFDDSHTDKVLIDVQFYN